MIKLNKKQQQGVDDIEDNKELMYVDLSRAIHKIVLVYNV